MDGEYAALIAKITDFLAGLEHKLSASMACKAGCDGCCQVWLAPSEVEADALRKALAEKSAPERAAIAERGRSELTRERSGAEPPRCALLSEEGRCSVYEARPIVCRTQGHALRYPRGVIPASAIRRRLSDGEVTACSLNFDREMPASAQTVDAERIDQLLALVNRRYAEARGLDPLRRHPISAIAAECDVLASDAP